MPNTNGANQSQLVADVLCVTILTVFGAWHKPYGRGIRAMSWNASTKVWSSSA
jgi:hypothetical protein